MNAIKHVEFSNTETVPGYALDDVVELFNISSCRVKSLEKMIEFLLYSDMPEDIRTTLYIAIDYLKSNNTLLNKCLNDLTDLEWEYSDTRQKVICL